MTDTEAAEPSIQTCGMTEGPSRASARGPLRFLGSRIAGASAGSCEARIRFDVFADRVPCNLAIQQISERTVPFKLEAGTNRVVFRQDWAVPISLIRIKIPCWTVPSALGLFSLLKGRDDGATITGGSLCGDTLYTEGTIVEISYEHMSTFHSLHEVLPEELYVYSR